MINNLIQIRFESFVALIIIFQPEIRGVLEQLGRSQLLGRHKILTVDEREKLVYEVVNAIDYLRKSKIGALIVIERDVSLLDYINRAKSLYADLSSELLISIFFPNNPLHDGAVIIQGNRISCAGAVFPTSNSISVNKRLGTRHRAALGIAEETDAIGIVVSEETEPNAIKINEIRVSKGMKPLDIVVVSFVLADNRFIEAIDRIIKNMGLKEVE